MAGGRGTKGRENGATFGRRMRGTGVYAELIAGRFAGMPAFDCEGFSVPREGSPQ